MESSTAPRSHARLTRAHVVPFAVFMGFLLILEIAGFLVGWDHPAAPWWRQDPALWIYPIQTLTALGCVLWFWKSYEFNWSWKWSAVAVLFGAVGIGFWLLPSHLHDRLGLGLADLAWMKQLGFAAREDGFDPEVFENQPLAYGFTVLMRFMRAVVAVALVEEIFWRGFLMRFVCDWEGDYWKQPFGRATRLSYFVVTALFMIAHAPVDWAAAWIYGSLTYVLCVWSRNLGACIVMHAVANLLMCFYIMAYGKYGLW